jgi:MoaE-MoaD fusion protein
MRVRVLFFGVLKDIVGHAEEELEVPSGSTPSTIFELYSKRYDGLQQRRSSILFARNQEFTSPATTVTEQDEIAFLPPVSGGSGSHESDGTGHVFSLTREPIESAELARRLTRPEDGAAVVFEGVVRNNTKGRLTLHLEYECYEAMALEQIARIGREIAAQFSLGHIGVIHRLGTLQVGELSVAIVATAPHRRSAFEAASLMIDRLKREVPIWKKEFFADGAVWVEGEWSESLLATSGRPQA